MSQEQTTEIKITKGWNWEARLTAGLALAAAAFFVVTFYFNTLSSNERQDREIKELNDKIIKQDVMLHSKVGIEQFEDFRQDVHSDMKEIKALVIKLYEK
jgi:hypothetical protein